jgi:outer membrane protein OmpA-like peptidoglycan-associated protein
VKRLAFRTPVVRNGLAVAVTMAFAAPVCAAPEFDLQFTRPVIVMADLSQPLTSYALPIGPFKAGTIPTRQVEGRLEQNAWRMPAEAQSTLDLMQPLRSQITAAGFKVIFDCEAEACGGFDFRYGIPVLPEPDMHVDLGDFRYFSAERDGVLGKEYLSLLVSRSPLDGYVQLTRVGALEAPPPALTASTKTPEAASEPEAPAIAPSGGSDDATLASGLPLVLEDLVFASGAASLEAGEYASLAALAEWLRANPGKVVMLVGHTDASGGLAANIALSKRRAESVRQVLLRAYDVAPGQVVADGVGPLAPRAGNLDEDGRRKNRRVEVFLTSTQ